MIFKLHALYIYFNNPHSCTSSSNVSVSWLEKCWHWLYFFIIFFMSPLSALLKKFIKWIKKWVFQKYKWDICAWLEITFFVRYILMNKKEIFIHFHKVNFYLYHQIFFAITRKNTATWKILHENWGEELSQMRKMRIEIVAMH